MATTAMIRDLLLATLAMLLTSGLAVLVGTLLAPHNVLLVFFIGVLAVSVRTSVGPALWSAVFGFLAYNFLFTEPRHSFEIMHREDLFTVFFFLLLSGVIGHQATRLRRHMLAQEAGRRHMQDLLTLSRELAGAPDSERIDTIAVSFLHERLQSPVAVIRRDQAGQLRVGAANAGESPLRHDGVQAATQAWASAMPRESRYYCFYPLIADGKTLALLAVGRGGGEPDYLVGARQQLAQALKRTELVSELERAKLDQETDQLRTALLASVSHDLKTPLAAMIGATSSAIQYADRLSASERNELLETTLQEAERLHRYIQNLLDMVKLGGGHLRVERDWVTASDLVNAAVGHLERLGTHSRVRVSVPTTLPLLYVHAELMEQALINILENAARFSPADTAITVRAYRQQRELILEVIDQGPGIPPGERDKVFDMFYSVTKGDRQQGSGLGLAICKGMVAAHGGRVEALAGHSGTGTCVRIALPLDDQPPMPDDTDKEAT